MGYFNEFPHTRSYDGDLGYLIKMYKKLVALYKSNNEYLEEIIENLEGFAKEQLKEWLTDGTLESILNTTLMNKKPNIYRSVDDMKNDNALDDNIICQTLSFYALNDGGGAFYLIKSGLVADGSTVIALANGKFAQLIYQSTMTAKQFGAHGDGTTDDHLFLSNLFTHAKTCILADSVYANSATIMISNNENVQTILGNNSEIRCITNGLQYQLLSTKDNLTIQDVFFNQNLKGRLAMHLQNCENILLKRIKISGYTAEYGWYQNDNAIYLDNVTNTCIDECYFINNGNQYDTTGTTLNRCIGTSGGYDFNSNITIKNSFFNSVNLAIVLDSSNIIIDSCYFNDVKDNILYSFGNNITFINCRCENSTDEGLVIGSENGGFYNIKNNYFYSVPNNHIVINNMVTTAIIDNNVFIEPNTHIFNFRSGASADELILTNNYFKAANPTANNIRAIILGTINKLFRFSGNYCVFGNVSQFFQLNALPAFNILSDNYFISENGDGTVNLGNVQFVTGIFNNNAFSGCRMNIGELKNIPQVQTNAGPYQNGNARLIFGTAQPTVGTFSTGDIVLNLNADARTLGWKCTASGTPGTWSPITNGS